MEFTSFTTLVRDEVEKRAGENYRVRLSDVRKNNGLVLSGLTVMKDDSNISPTIYLNNYYEAYINGNLTLINVVNDVMDAYNKNKVDHNIDMKYFLDFERVRDNIIYKLVNTEKNRELLEDVPHVEFLDLSIVFSCLVAKKEEATASILIHNAHLKLWNIDLEELYRAARNNTSKLMGYDIRNMDEIVCEMIAQMEDEGAFVDEEMKSFSASAPMYVLTNRNRIDGAACILYPNLLQDLATSIGGGFYVIPSSIHEVIIVPSDDISDADDIRIMISEVNDTQVRIDEILSYSLYYYDDKNDKLSKV